MTNPTKKQSFEPIEDGSELDTQICFAVGELSRSELEDTAEEAEVDFDKHTTSDDLRAFIIEAAREAGGIKILDREGGVLTFGFVQDGPLPIFDPKAEVPIPNPKANAALDLSPMNEVDGFIIPHGKFQGMKLTAQSALGVLSDRVNVHTSKGVYIGETTKMGAEDFINGDENLLIPDKEWPLKWSEPLIELFKLRERLNNPLLAQAVKIETGTDENNQMANFQNGTLQSLGPDLAITIQTFVEQPSNENLQESELNAYVKQLLTLASAATGGKLRFEVQIGPSIDALNENEKSPTP
jgi:hypothetical protein